MYISNRWDHGHDEILRQEFATASQERLLDLLPGRSYASVRARAHRLGVCRDGRAARIPQRGPELVRGAFACASRRGLSQSDLVGLSGIAKWRLNDWSVGRSDPSVKGLSDLWQSLGYRLIAVSTSEVLEGDLAAHLLDRIARCENISALARRAGITTKAIGGWIRGSQPSLQTLIAAYGALGFSIVADPQEDREAE